MNVERLLALLEQAKEKPHPELFVAMHFELDLLEYMTRPREGWKEAPRTPTGASCGLEWCQATTLFNFAREWEQPKFYCADHHPPFDSSFWSPVGWPVSPKVLRSRAVEMTDRWTKFRDQVAADETL